MSGPTAKILDVDADILEAALILIRDRYDLATQANVFLELTGVSGIHISITNQRDAFSHLVTLLQSPTNFVDADDESRREAQRDQLANLSEHLRRAIFEPYEVAIEIIDEKTDGVVAQYQQSVLTLPGLQEQLPAAPGLDEIQTIRGAVNKKRLAARMAKNQNVHNTAWQDGTRDLILAFEELKKLQARLEGYIAQAERKRQIKRTARRAWALMILGALVGFGLKVLADYILQR